MRLNVQSELCTGSHFTTACTVDTIYVSVHHSPETLSWSSTTSTSYWSVPSLCPASCTSSVRRHSRHAGSGSTTTCTQTTVPATWYMCQPVNKTCCWSAEVSGQARAIVWCVYNLSLHGLSFSPNHLFDNSVLIFVILDKFKVEMQSSFFY